MLKTVATRIVGLAMAMALLAPASGLAQGIAGPYLAAQQAEMRGDVAAAARLYARTLARDPNNADVMESAMLHQIAAGNVSEGIALARRYNSIRPNHHVATLALAADSMRAGDHDTAREVLGENSPFAGQILSAWAAFGDDDTDAARERLSLIIDSDQNGVSGQIVAGFHLGLIEAAAGNDEAAVAAIERATELSDGGTLRMVRQQAAALARLGRTEEAQAVISNRLAATYGDAALSSFGDEIGSGLVPPVEVGSPALGSAEVLFSIAGLLARGQNRLVALAYARLAAHLNPNLSEAQLLIAQVLDRGDQFDLAIEAYDSITSDAPESLRARIGKAEALQASGRVEEGVAEMRATIEAFPDDIEARTSLGDMLRRESRFDEASVAYDGAVSLVPEIQPHHWALFYQRGITLERSNEWDKAEADFRRALELEPDQPDVLNYLGYSWVEQGLNLAEAEEMIRKAVDQRPDDGYIVDSLGWVLYRFGEFDQAVIHLERAVELRPVDPVINDHYGDALWMVGRRIEAQFQWKRALSFEPTDKDATRIRLKLETGLDSVLASEKEAGLPGIIGRQTSENDKSDLKTPDDG